MVGKAFNLRLSPDNILCSTICWKAVKAVLEAGRRVVYNHGSGLISVSVEVFESKWGRNKD